MKPLYLYAAEPMIVILDGPALRVRRRHRAEGLFPLARVSRVVISGAVEIRTPALTACLARGIPVSFVQRDGTPVGLCIGHRLKRTGISSLLEELFCISQWPELYENWRKAAERQAIRDTLRSLHIEVSDYRPRTVRNFTAQTLEKLASTRDIARARAIHHSALTALVLRTAADFGVQPEHMVGLQRGFCLRDELCGILEWRLFPVHVRCLRDPDSTHLDPRRRHRAAIAHFEHNASELQRHCYKLLSSLEYWLQGIHGP